MFNYEEWELFYTNSDKDDDYVNQICIDVARKRYILELDADHRVTDGFDEFGNEIYSYYVSKEIFNIIVNGVKESGFKECQYSEV